MPSHSPSLTQLGYHMTSLGQLMACISQKPNGALTNNATFQSISHYSIFLLILQIHFHYFSISKTLI